MGAIPYKETKPLDHFNVIAFPPIRKKPRMDGAPSFIYCGSETMVGDYIEDAKILRRSDGLQFQRFLSSCSSSIWRPWPSRCTVRPWERI